MMRTPRQSAVYVFHANFWKKKFMVVAWTYAVTVNFAPSYRDTVDKVGEGTVGLQVEITKDEEAVGMEDQKLNKAAAYA